MHLSPHTIERLGRIQALLDELQPDAAPQSLLVPGSPKPRSSIIVFPGSFNPPTVAHIALLEQARVFAHAHFHEPMLLYAAISKRIVDKEKVERPSLLDRIALLDTVLKRRLRNTGILLFNRGLYVEQAEAIHASFPKARRIFFLLGFDKIVQILDPRYYQDRDASLIELFKLAQLLVAPRGNDGPEALAALLHQPENARFAPFIHGLGFNASYRNVSSTRIREGLDVRDVPREVRQFMRETRAYASPLHRPDGSEVDYYAERMKCIEQLLQAHKGDKYRRNTRFM